MKKILYLIILYLTISAHAAELRGNVVSVSDGDTVTILDAGRHQHKVRLAGIDAPEKAQEFGKTSKQRLSEQIFGQNVVVIWEKHDRYGRIIGKILLNDIDICLEQIKQGMAWHYKQYQKDQPSKDREEYSDAETFARNAYKGLWSHKDPIAPWIWRHQK